MSASIFDFVSDELERLTRLEKLEARGTVRLALKAAGLDVRTVTTPQMVATLQKVMPNEIRARGVENARADLPDDRDRAGSRPPLVRRRRSRIARGDLPPPGPGLTPADQGPRPRRRGMHAAGAGTRRTATVAPTTEKSEIRWPGGELQRVGPARRHARPLSRRSPKWGKLGADRECHAASQIEPARGVSGAGRGEGSGPPDLRSNPPGRAPDRSRRKQDQKSASCLSSGPVRTNGPHPFRTSSPAPFAAPRPPLYWFRVGARCGACRAVARRRRFRWESPR